MRRRTGGSWPGAESALTILLGLAAAALSLASCCFGVSTWDSWPARGLVLLALALAAAVDLREGIVPPLVSHPLLAGAAARAAAELNAPGLAVLGIALWDVRIEPPVLERALHLSLAVGALGLGAVLGDEAFPAAVVWMLVYWLWRANWIGGGDGKLLIALSGLYPGSTLWVALGWLAVGLLWIAVIHRGALLAGVTTVLVAALSPHQVSREELEERGVPMAAAIAAGWTAYLLFLALLPVLQRGAG